MESDSCRRMGKGISMKRKQIFLSALILGCMCLAMGCGSREADSDGQAVQAQKVEGEDHPSAGDGSGQEALENGTGLLESEISRAPQITIESKNFDRYSEDGSQWLLHVAYDTAAVDAEGYEAAAEEIRQWMAKKEASLQEIADEYAGWAEEDESYTDTDYYRYSIFREIEASRMDRHVISLIELHGDYTGGAHGNYGFTGYTFDAQSGTILDISDILKDTEGFKKTSVDYITKYLKEEYQDELFSEYEGTVEEIWTRDEGPDWYLDAAGITFIFNPYEIGPFAMGEVRVTLPYEEFSPFIKEEYMGLSGAGMAVLPKGQFVSLPSADNGGQTEKLRFYQESQDEYADGPVFVELNGTASEAGTFARTGDAYLLQMEDGRRLVLLDADYASDDFVTFVYEIVDGTLQERDRVEGLSLQEGSVNTENLKLHMHLDVIGTYSGVMNYKIGEDGQLIPQGEWFEIADTADPWKLMVTKKELPVRMDEEEAMLPVGSRIYITATDNEGTALFRNEDTGAEGEILYTRGDTEEDAWVIYINGVPDYDYFELIPYAG